MRSRIDSRGRVLIPKSLRTKLGWGPGTLVEFRQQGNALHLEAVQEGPAVVMRNGLLMCTAKPLMDTNKAIRLIQEERIRLCFPKSMRRKRRST